MPDRERLETVLGEFYDLLRDGADLDLLVRKHPDLEEEIRAHFDLLELVDRGFEAERSVESGRPEQIGEYRIVREIGRGGMGVVYEAEQMSMDRRVALKVLSPSVTRAAQAILRFEREARAAGKLHHQNIAPVYGMGRDRGFHYYAMELVDGRTLGEVIAELKTGADETAKEGGPFGTTTHGREHFVRLAEAIAGVAEALHAAHEEGVVHRDVKPTNLLLAADGTLKLVDFGLAHLAGEGAGMTASGQILGTPHYMSPEQAMARRVHIDFRTDIYSLGATLYEALTLRTPFTGDSIPAVCSAIVNKEPSAPRKVNPSVPRDLETIVRKAMEKDPRRRYATAREMAKDLRRFAVGMPIRARRIGPVARTWRRVKRNKIRTALVAAIVVLVAVGAGFMMHASSKTARLREADYERLIAWAGDAMASEAAPRVPAGVGSAMPTTETAAAILSRAIELIPDRAEGYWLRALAAGRTNPQRHNDLDRAEKLGLARGTAHMLRTNLFRMAGRLADAEKEGKLAALHEDGSPLGLYAKARLLAGEHRRSKAIETATQALVHPEVGRTVRAYVLRLRAHLRLETEDWPGAHADLLALETLGDESFRTRVQIASLWRKLGCGDVGERLFDEMLRELESADDPALWERANGACRAAREMAWFHRSVKEALARFKDDLEIREAQALSLLERGEREEALEVANLLVKREPDGRRGHELRARALLSLDRLDDALLAVRHLLELTGPSPAALMVEGNILLRLGDPEQARAAFQSALELNPANYSASLNVGVALQRLGEWEDALRATTRATRLEPRLWKAWILRWNLLHKLGRMEEAVEEMKTIVSRKATTRRTLHLRGHALERLRWNDEALAVFERASRLENEAQPGGSPDRDCLLIDRVDVLVVLKEPGKALQACEEALHVLDPSSPYAEIAWGMKSELLSEAGRHQEALDANDQAMKLWSHSAKVFLHRARAHVFQKMGKYQESLIPIQLGLETEPHDSTLLLMKGIALAETGESEKARAVFRIFIREGPSMQGAARAFEHLARKRVTFAAFEEALRSAPDSFAKHELTAYLNLMQGRFDQAFTAAGLALEIDPDHTGMLNLRGMILCDRRKDYRGALEAFNHAISINDRRCVLHANRGNALKGLGEIKKAIEAYGRSLELRPTWGVLFSLGRCYSLLGDSAKAREYCTRALEINPRSLRSLYVLVQSLRRLGEEAEAVSAAKKHVNCDLRNEPPFILAWTCAVAGDRDRALAAIRSMGTPSSPGDLYPLARVYALLGETESALEALEEAFEAGLRFPADAPHDPDLASLRHHPRYRALHEKLRGR